MKRFLFYILSTVVFAGFSNAQDSRIDSLLNQTAVISGPELSKIYYELSCELLNINPDSALYFANQSELALQKDDQENLLPYLYKNKGKIYVIKMV